ncbi:MAG: AraC family transcriptional regulator [Bacteroidota bacterium]
MNHFLEEVERIKGIVFANQPQVDLAVNTKRYIDTHFDTPINLEVLAQAQLTSKYHLARIFKKYHGITPRQYLINKRIQKAKAELAAGKSVSDTCYSVGFESIHSFSNLFKSKTGMPPSAYRKATFDKPET